MEQVEYRAVIRFMFLKGKSIDDTKTELDSVYGDLAPSIATVKRWVAEFKRGRTSIFDEHRSGRPIFETRKEIVEKALGLVLGNPIIKVRELSETLGLSTSTVVSILHENLGMK